MFRSPHGQLVVVPFFFSFFLLSFLSADGILLHNGLTYFLVCFQAVVCEVQGFCENTGRSGADDSDNQPPPALKHISDISPLGCHTRHSQYINK